MANFGNFFGQPRNYGYSQESERPVSNLFYTKDSRQDNRGSSLFDRRNTSDSNRGYDTQSYDNKSYTDDRDSRQGWNNQSREDGSRYQGNKNSQSFNTQSRGRSRYLDDEDSYEHQPRDRSRNQDDEDLYEHQPRDRSRYDDRDSKSYNDRSGDAYGNSSYQDDVPCQESNYQSRDKLRYEDDRNSQSHNYQSREVYQEERKTYGNNPYQDIFYSRPEPNMLSSGGNTSMAPYQDIFDLRPEPNTLSSGGNTSMTVPKNLTYNLFDMPTDSQQTQEPVYERRVYYNFKNERNDKPIYSNNREANQQNNSRGSWNSRGRSRGFQRRQETKQFERSNKKNVIEEDNFSIKQEEFNEGEDFLSDQTPSEAFEDEEFEGGGDIKGEGNYEFHSDGEGEDNEEKVNTFIPEPALVSQYKYYPPNYQELGKIFKGLVICFFFKVKNVPEKNPFVTICESFRRSDRFGPLAIEDGFLQGDRYVKFCTIRYNGMMLVRGVGETGNVKEPRVRAAVELINELARTCYTLKMKTGYFSNDAFQAILDLGECPGVFKVVPKEETPTINSAKEYIDNFFRKDTDCELILCDHVYDLKWYVKQKNFACRTPRHSYLAICKKRTPQYWRDKFLASGKMEDERYELYRPTGESKVLIDDFEVQDCIPALKKIPHMHAETFDRSNLYGEKNVGPNIDVVSLPWDKNRRGGGRGRGRGGRGRGGRRRRFGKPKKNMSRIKSPILLEKQLDEIKGYKYLNKSRKLKRQIRINI